MLQYIADTDHYTEVLQRMCKARRLLWIATADLKDLYVVANVSKRSSIVANDSYRSKSQHSEMLPTKSQRSEALPTNQQPVPFLKILSDLLKCGVEVRLLHAKEPCTAFREDFDKFPTLWKQLDRRLCPRVHMKLIAIDSEIVYIGSANMTGAGLGMKSATRRNFEAGILTDEPGFVDSVMTHFDSVWEGTHCKKCGRKDFCHDRINS